MKKTIRTLAAAGAVAGAGVLGAADFGLVNVGADDPHFPAVHAFLAMARDRSIEVRARDIEVPNLKNENLIRIGAGNYNAMCIGCHLAPGVEKTELSQALYPSPQDPSKLGASGDRGSEEPSKPRAQLKGDVEKPARELAADLAKVKSLQVRFERFDGLDHGQMLGASLNAVIEQ